MSYKNKPGVLLSITLLAFAAVSARAADGYGGSATGGAGGTAVTVTTTAQLTQYATATGKYIITVSGTITLPDNLHVTSNKTIQGANTSATINGDLFLGSGSSSGTPTVNVIVQNLNFTNPNGVGDHDGISVKNNAANIFITHCTFSDCKDGSLDITEKSDNVTVSWCRFRYPTIVGHDFVNLVGASDSQTGDAGKLHCTFHHNWYDAGCVERMPRVRFGRVHVYNNYYGCAGNNYCVGVGEASQILVENDYFDGVTLPWKNYSKTVQGLIHWNTGNVFVNTTIPTWAPNSTVFTPPYSYTLTAGSSVKSTVTASAGNH
jgi:pectate lyase